MTTLRFCRAAYLRLGRCDVQHSEIDVGLDHPDTHPAVDDPSVVDFILRRARDIELVHVYPAGAATKGLAGQQMAEIGLMHEAGCVYVTDADRPIVDCQRIVMVSPSTGTVNVSRV